MFNKRIYKFDDKISQFAERISELSDILLSGNNSFPNIPINGLVQKETLKNADFFSELSKKKSGKYVKNREKKAEIIKNFEKADPRKKLVPEYYII